MKQSSCVSRGKENFVQQNKIVKRKLIDVDVNESLNTSKRRRVNVKKKSVIRVSGAKYNLRTRR